MARTETGVQVIAPQTRAAVGVDAYEQHFADPTAGADMAAVAQALGLAADVSAQSDAQRKAAADKAAAAKEAEYTQNLDYHAQSFMADRGNGLVDATQVGKALPGASPIVTGKVTGLIGQNWGNTYARAKLDEFLAQGDAARLDPTAQRTFFDGLRADVAQQTQGNPFYGQGALSATNSIINEYESNLQRENATYQQGLQETDFTANVSSALMGQPIAAATPGTYGTVPAEDASFLISRLVTQGRDSDIIDMEPQFASGISSLIQSAPPGIAEGLGVLSGTRSTERQQVLWDQALKTYGSAAEARKWVAPPGNSKHNHGQAADLSYNGRSLKHAPPEVVAWVHEHAASHGLHFPLANENWHVEPMGSRGGGGAVQVASLHPTQGIDPTTSPTALLEMIGGAEASGNYNAYSDNARNTSLRFTDMSINDVLQWQRNTIATGATTSSAVGKYQIVRATMLETVKALGLSGDEKFTPQLQDAMAMHLLKGRGYDKFVAGEITASEFQDSIAKEWASLPTSAGHGYYPGQRATVESGPLRVAMSTQGAVPDAIAGLDTAALATTSINPIRSREIIVTTAIQLATQHRDTAILDRIPPAMLAVPEIGMKVAAARTAITNMSFDDWNHQRQVEAYEKSEAVEQGQVAILKKLSEEGRIDPAEYLNDPDMYAFAKSVQADEMVRPEVSASNSLALGQELLGYGTIGIPQQLPGNSDYERLRNVIMHAPKITAADRQRMLGEIPTYLEGVNLLGDPGTSQHYTNYVGNGLNAYLTSPEGAVSKIMGDNTVGLVRAAFDDTLTGLIEDSIADGNGVPRGSAKRAMLKTASDAASALLEQLKSTSAAPAAPATTTSTSNPPAATTSTQPVLSQEQVDALRTKVEAGVQVSDEELVLYYTLP